jgi:hypothetical protein
MNLDHDETWESNIVDEDFSGILGSSSLVCWPSVSEVTFDFSRVLPPDSPSTAPGAAAMVVDDSCREEAPPAPNQMTYDGHIYVKHSENAKTSSVYYRCLSYRSNPPCKAKMTYKIQDGTLLASDVPHSCIRALSSEKVVGKITDVTAEIKEMVLERALTEVTIVAEKLAREIHKEVQERHAGIFNLLKNIVAMLIFNINDKINFRRSNYGSKSRSDSAFDIQC